MSIIYPSSTSGGGATLQGNTFIGNQTITGSLLISGSNIRIDSSGSINNSSGKFNGVSTGNINVQVTAAEIQLNYGGDYILINGAGLFVYNGSSYTTNLPWGGGMLSALTPLNLYSNLAGGADTCVQLGASSAAASVNIGTKLASIGTGVGTSFTGSMSFYKGGILGGDVGSGLLTLNGTLAAQLSYNGAKFSAGTYVANQPVVESSLGASAADVCTRIGTTIADASVNAAAKLLSVGTGIGGTYTEKAWINKAGDLYAASGIFRGDGAQASVHVRAESGGVHLAYGGQEFQWGASGASFHDGTGYAGTISTLAGGLNAQIANIIGNSRLSGSLQTVGIMSALGTGSGDTSVRLGTSVADASVNASAKLVSIGTGLTGSYIEALSITKGANGGFGLSSGASLGSLSMNNSVGVQLSWNNNTILILDDEGIKPSGVPVILGSNNPSVAAVPTNNTIGYKMTGLATSQFTVGNLVRYTVSGTLAKMDITAAGAAREFIGVALENDVTAFSRISTTAGTIVNTAFVSAPASASLGSPVYASPTAGLATTTVPSGSGQRVFMIGLLANANSGSGGYGVLLQPRFIVDL